jgi:addiction module HigA family antidote
MEMYNPVHPGRLIRESMGEGITVSALAKHLGVTRAHMSMIINGRAGLSATMALKLDETFENSDGFWWRVQSAYELAKARRTKRKKLKSLKKQSFKTLAEISAARKVKRPIKAEPRTFAKAA